MIFRLLVACDVRLKILRSIKATYTNLYKQQKKPLVCVFFSHHQHHWIFDCWFFHVRIYSHEHLCVVALSRFHTQFHDTSAQAYDLCRNFWWLCACYLVHKLQWLRWLVVAAVFCLFEQKCFIFVLRPTSWFGCFSAWYSIFHSFDEDIFILSAKLISFH